MPKKDRHTARNPYMQIARKIIQTNRERLEDISLMEAEISSLKKNEDGVRIFNLPDTIPGTDGKMTLEDKESMIAALQDHIERLEYYTDIVADAFDEACRNIPDKRIADQVKECLMRFYDDGKEIPFYLLNYPFELNRADFEERKRILLKCVLREMGIMPYQHQPAFLAEVKAAHRIRPKKEKK